MGNATIAEHKVMIDWKHLRNCNLLNEDGDVTKFDKILES
jgi:hypothetical protein